MTSGARVAVEVGAEGAADDDVVVVRQAHASVSLPRRAGRRRWAVEHAVRVGEETGREVDRRACRRRCCRSRSSAAMFARVGRARRPGAPAPTANVSAPASLGESVTVPVGRRERERRRAARCRVRTQSPRAPPDAEREHAEQTEHCCAQSAPSPAAHVPPSGSRPSLQRRAPRRRPHGEPASGEVAEEAAVALDQRAVGVDLAAVAQIADEIPVQRALVGAAGDRVGGAERHVHRAADLLVQERVERRAPGSPR